MTTSTIGTARQALLRVAQVLDAAGFTRDAEVEGTAGSGPRYRLRIASMEPHESFDADWALELHVFLIVPMQPGLEVETAIQAPELTEKLAGVVAALNGKDGIGVAFERAQLGRTGPDYVSESVFTVAYQYKAI